MNPEYECDKCQREWEAIYAHAEGWIEYHEQKRLHKLRVEAPEIVLSFGGFYAAG